MLDTCQYDLVVTFDLHSLADCSLTCLILLVCLFSVVVPIVVVVTSSNIKVFSSTSISSSCSKVPRTMFPRLW